MFKQELEHKRNLLQKIKQQQKNISMFEQDLANRTMSSKNGMPSGTGTPSVRSHAEMVRRPSGHHEVSPKEQTHPPLYGDHGGKQPLMLNSRSGSNLGSRQRSEAQLFHLQEQRFDQRQTKTITDYSRNQLHHGHTSSKYEDRIQAMRHSSHSSGGSRPSTSPAQHFSYDKYHHGSYHKGLASDQYHVHGDTHPNMGHPLRMPSGSPSPDLSKRAGHSSNYLGSQANQFGFMRHGSIIPTNHFVSKETIHSQPLSQPAMASARAHHYHGAPHEYNMQEISSINARPMHPSLTAINDDSQYVFTSQHTSIVEDDLPERFVFNSNVLQASGSHPEDMRAAEITASDQRMTASPTNIKNETGDLSEPQILSAEVKQHMNATQGREAPASFRKQVQQHSQPQAHGVGPARHHAGGSFGNLKELGQAAMQPQSQPPHTDISNSFVRLEKVLEGTSRKVTGEADTNYNTKAEHCSNEEPSTRRQTNGSTKQIAKDETATISEAPMREREDSSLEFQERKYKIQQRKSSKSSLHRNPRYATTQDERSGRVEFYGEPSSRQEEKSRHSKNRSQRHSSSSERRQLKKKQKKQRSKSSKHHHTERRLSSSQSSEEKGDERSQVSLSQKSQGSYGKYFLKQRKSFTKRATKGDRADRSLLSANSSKSRKHKKGGASSHSRRREAKQSLHSPNLSNLAYAQRESPGREGRRSRSRQNRQGSDKSLPSKAKTMKPTSQKRNNSFSRSRSATRQQLSQPVAAAKLASGRPPMSQTNPFQTLILKENNASALNTIGYAAHHLSSKRASGSQSCASAKKGAQATNTSRASSKAKVSKKSQKQQASDDHSIAHKLLQDMAKKYKNMEKNRMAGLHSASMQKDQMISEIQSLAASLIKAEKRISKLKSDFKEKEAKLKEVVDDQEDCIRLLEAKNSKLTGRMQKLKKEEEKATVEREKDEQVATMEMSAVSKKMEDLRRKLVAEKKKFTEEKKEIIINMERDHQAQTQKLSKKADIKIQGLTSLNDQLNLKLQDHETLQLNYENLQKEYSNSLTLLNEFQDTIQSLEHEEQKLKEMISDLQLKLDHEVAMAAESKEQYAASLHETESKWEAQLKQIQQAHSCELQKAKLAQDMNEDSSRYQYEVKLNSLSLSLKQKDEALKEARETIDQVMRKIDDQADSFKQREAALLESQKEVEEQRDRYEMEARDLENRLTQLNFQAEKAESQKLALSQEHVNTGRHSHEHLAVVDELEGVIRDKDRQLRDLKSALAIRESEYMQKERDMQEQMRLMQEKIDLQQQEIHILAQGFQAQQLKLNSRPGAQASSNRQSSEGLPNQIFSSGATQTQPGPDSHRSQRRAQVTSAQGYLINHQNIMALQNAPISNSDRDFEDFSEQYVESEAEGSAFIEQSQIREHGELSATSTERKLNAISESKQRHKGSTQTFGNNGGYGNFAVAEYNPGAQQIGTAVANDQLLQKNEEIKILWNVISQLQNGGSSQLSDAPPLVHGSFGGDQKGLLLGNQTGKLSLSNAVGSQDYGRTSGGNQSSIMNINPTNNYMTGGLSSEGISGCGSAVASSRHTKHSELNLRMQAPQYQNAEQRLSSEGFISEPIIPSESATADAYQHAIQGFGYQQNEALLGQHDSSVSHPSEVHEYESTPLVKEKGLITFTAKNSSHSKELSDVKKRIQRLMGRGPGSRREADTSEASFNEEFGSKESRVESEGIEQYNVKSQQVYHP